jgi:hypothetical protein
MLIFDMLYPQTVQWMMDWWDSLYKNAWTKFSSKGLLQAICSVLHISDNENHEEMNTDSLQKFWPPYQNKILKDKLSQCATFGTEFSFDEAAMNMPVNDNTLEV